METTTETESEVPTLNIQKEFLEIQRRSDLKKYYKYVKECSLCKKNYGTDTKKNENGQCSMCSKRLRKYTDITYNNKLKGGI